MTEVEKIAHAALDTMPDALSGADLAKVVAVIILSYERTNFGRLMCLSKAAAEIAGVIAEEDETPLFGAVLPAGGVKQ